MAAPLLILRRRRRLQDQIPSQERTQNAAAPQSAEVVYLTPADAPPCAREAGLTRSEIEQFQSDGERTRAFELAHFVTLAMPTMMLCHRVIAT